MKIGKLQNYILNKLAAELSSQLTYPGVCYTEHVYDNCMDYNRRMQINEKDAYL